MIPFLRIPTLDSVFELFLGGGREFVHLHEFLAPASKGVLPRVIEFVQMHEFLGAIHSYIICIASLTQLHHGIIHSGSSGPSGVSGFNGIGGISEFNGLVNSLGSV